MLGFNLTLLVVTLNGNCLNMPTKRQRLSDWVRKEGLLYAYRNHTLNKKTQKG